VQDEGGRINLGHRSRHGGLAFAITGEAKVDMVEIQLAPEDGLIAHPGPAGAAPLGDRSSVKDHRGANGKRRGELEGRILVQADLQHLYGTVKRQVDGDVAHYARLIPEIDVFIDLTRGGILIRHRGTPVRVADVQIHTALSKKVHVPHAGRV